MIDDQSLHALKYQAKRMHHFLHDVTPPDRAEALRIQQRVDDILDRRPRPIAVASDGEIIWANQSGFVVGQVVAQNTTDVPEQILQAD